MINIIKKNFPNSLFLNMNLKAISLFFIVLNAYGLNEYTSTKNTGKNKYQRIGTIEEYLEKLSTQLPADFDKKIQSLQLQVDSILKNDNSPIEDVKKQIIKIREDLDKAKEENKQDIQKNLTILTEKIENQKKDTQIQIDSLRSSLETKILVIEKIISNFGKVEIK